MKIAFLAASATLALAVSACGDETSAGESTQTEATPTEQTTSEATTQPADAEQPTGDSEGSADEAGGAPSQQTLCHRQGQLVDNYDITSEGASRSAYLVQLHTLQRDCPKEAVKRGLASDFLKKCKALDQEDCTYYGRNP